MRRQIRARRAAYKPPEPKKVRSLAEQMLVGLLLRDDHILWVMHEKPLADPPEWVEYDGDDNTLIFVGKSGMPTELGLEIPANYKEVLLEAENVMIAHVENDKVYDVRLIGMATRETKDGGL